MVISATFNESHPCSPPAQETTHWAREPTLAGGAPANKQAEASWALVHRICSLGLLIPLCEKALLNLEEERKTERLSQPDIPADFPAEEGNVNEPSKPALRMGSL
jgi:hypothetical protein